MSEPIRLNIKNVWELHLAMDTWERIRGLFRHKKAAAFRKVVARMKDEEINQLLMGWHFYGPADFVRDLMTQPFEVTVEVVPQEEAKP